MGKSKRLENRFWKFLKMSGLTRGRRLFTCTAKPAANAINRSKCQHKSFLPDVVVSLGSPVLPIRALSTTQLTIRRYSSSPQDSAASGETEQTEDLVVDYLDGDNAGVVVFGLNRPKAKNARNFLRRRGSQRASQNETPGSWPVRF